ncbi:MAG: NUDIX domain-containing protein [Burkholderiales bacterium]|nr:MAG: NUDIX domain-containing protein [Burkholderiales bacterium]
MPRDSRQENGIIRTVRREGRKIRLGLTRWQRFRTRAFLFSVGVARRMTLGTRAVLIDGDKVFLIRQTYMPGWQFCGGGVEPGESAELSASREMLEETGYRPTAPMPLFGLYHNTNSLTNRDHVALFLCRDYEQVAAFRPNREIAEGGWFSIDALPEGTGPATIRRIGEIFRGEPITTNW